LWYRHDGRNDGSFRWASSQGKKIGVGWNVKELFASNGIVYAITPVVEASLPIGIGPGMGGHPASGGDLMWYRHVGREDGSFRWEGPKKVGNGWGSLKTVFSGGDGIIYGIQDNGDLMWYRHVGREDGSFRWEGPKKVGAGWGAFRKVFSGGDGIIYGIQDNGDLMWYRHLGREDGSFRWASNQGKKVGAGWYKFNVKQVFTD
jgi:hypothetical protein